MRDQLLQNLQEFERGVSDKGGFTSLDILIANLRTTGRIDRAKISEMLAANIRSSERRTPKFWLGCRSMIEDLQLRSRDLIGALELKLADAKLTQDADYQYEVAKSFALAGGDLTPLLLEELVQLRRSRAALWIDLAIQYSFAADAVGLTKSFVEISKDNTTNWQWTDIKTRYRKLSENLESAYLSILLRKFGDSIINTKDKYSYFKWLQEKTGRKYNNAEIIQESQKVINEQAIRFLSDNSRNAVRIIKEKELEAA